MDKDEVVEYLKGKGHDAFIDGFVVMVYVDHILTEKEHKKLEKEIAESGYRSSWGWRVKKKVIKE